MKWFTFPCFESIFFNSITDTLAALYKMTDSLFLINAPSSSWRQENHPPPQSASASPCVDVAWCQHSAWPPSGLVMGPWWWTRPLLCAACDPALYTHTHMYTHMHTHTHTHTHTHQNKYTDTWKHPSTYCQYYWQHHQKERDRLGWTGMQRQTDTQTDRQTQIETRRSRRSEANFILQFTFIVMNTLSTHCWYTKQNIYQTVRNEHMLHKQ